MVYVKVMGLGPAKTVQVDNNEYDGNIHNFIEKIYKNIFYLGLICIIMVTHYACEDDAILDPNLSDEDYYGSSYGTLIDNNKKQKIYLSKKNPFIF